MLNTGTCVTSPYYNPGSPPPSNDNAVGEKWAPVGTFTVETCSLCLLTMGVTERIGLCNTRLCGALTIGTTTHFTVPSNC